MHIFHFYHGHRLHRLHSTDFWLYELSIWLHTFSHSLVGIFIPIFMLGLGYNVVNVVLFYLLYNLIDTPLNLAARELVRRFGARIILTVATLFTIVFFVTFLEAKQAGSLTLLLLACTAAIYDSLYWVSHFFMFIQSGGTSKRASSNVGILYSVKLFASMLGPLIGAGILIVFDQSLLLYVAVAGLVCSIIPLISINDFKDKPALKPLQFKEFFALPHGRRIFLSTIFYAVHDSAESVLFPLFIFITFGSIGSVALIPVILSITAIGISLFLGNIHARRREFIIALGAALIALMWYLRLFDGTASIYYASVLIVGVCAYFILVPLDTAIFEHGRAVGDPLSASMYRNMAFMGTNIVLYAILALALHVFGVSFALAIVSLLALVLVNAAKFFNPRVAE